ncbi:galactosyltransferase-related protein [Mycoavidus sp. SF9855]|uniref:galactosyltransferase-related protein n=1 Tax=Mycoavidus sp. SF9855 TaxID=2968475 RepID=UPI00211C90FC|nr:galactosyltransferase-related protein [Mycoavidus sp. SF9855]UUM22036.1 galactosyltransferase-related protein [Mycoavidus sp. SF9855]
MSHYGNETRCEKFISGFNYGSICCTKENLEKVEYYTNDFIKKGWGGEDDNIRSKLEAKGIVKKILNDAKLLHLESNREFEMRFLKMKNIIHQGSELAYDNFSKID